jgi:hypothetical protein
MGFETVVLTRVTEVLGSAQAEFSFGTLFVCDVTPREATKLQEALIAMTATSVSMCRVDDEYSYDFTAA